MYNLKKKLASAIAMILMSALVVTGVCAQTYEPGSFSGVSFRMLNTKAEIEEQLEEAASVWNELTGGDLEVYTIATTGTPAEEISARYAAGDAPTLIMADPSDISNICVEKGIDLSDQAWAEVGGAQFGVTVDGVLYSFPFCIEGRGLIYNKTAIESVTGETFDPEAILTLDDLIALLEKLRQGGMENPVAVNCEDWSLGSHYMWMVYEEQDGATALTNPMIDALYEGKANLAEDAIFNQLFDTFDVLKEYNKYKKDPMAADRSESGADLAEGELAFWFDGNWAWSEVAGEYNEASELGIMPVPQNDVSGTLAGIMCGSPSKQVMIDKECSTEEQRAAAKDFLNWLVFSEEGQDVMVNKCSMVPAFSNIDVEATNPLALSVQKYSKAGKLFPGYVNYPGDHWQMVGAILQKYLGGQIDRAGLAAEIEAYWAALK